MKIIGKSKTISIEMSKVEAQHLLAILNGSHLIWKKEEEAIEEEAIEETSWAIYNRLSELVESDFLNCLEYRRG